MNQTISEDHEGRVWIGSAGSVSLLDPRTGVATNYWHLLSSVGEVFTEAAPALLPKEYAESLKSSERRG